MNEWMSYFPTPVQAVMRMFRQESLAAVKMLAKEMGYVSREDFLAQKALVRKLQQALDEIKEQQ
jgi:hypothetical protein